MCTRKPGFWSAAWLLSALVLGGLCPRAWGEQTNGQNPVAKLAILGTGAPEGIVALFAHGFAQGQLKPTEAVVLQRADNQARLQTQMNPVTSWPDGSVKVALLAVEAPALDKGEALECVLVKAAQGRAVPPLEWAKLVKGRQATLIVKPKEGEPWRFDLLAGLEANRDRWRDGPLALSTRVETQVPPQHLNGVTSVRLVADVIATQDGILEIDWRLANDAVRKAGGGPATYAYEVAIDGETVYSQAEAKHIQYTAWVRTRGRAAGGAMPERPLIRPDYDLLVRGGFTLPWDRSLPSQAHAEYLTQTIQKGLPTANTAYPALGICRQAGEVGGRQEIGYRTYAGMVWIKTGHPEAQFLAHRQMEVGSSRPQNFWDEERGTWLTLEDWPCFTSGVQWQNTCPLNVPREKATGFPADQKSTANAKEHVTVDHAHNADYWSVVALLSGRRMAFDGLAMNAAWVTADNNERQPRVLPDGKLDWWSPPDFNTGVAWAPKTGAPQVRGFAWGLRSVALAAALLPDRFPRREYYNRNALAWINAYGVNLKTLAEERGELAGWIPHTNGRTHTPGFMTSFVFYALLDALNLGVAGPHGPAVLQYFSNFRINAFNRPEFNWRNAACGRDIPIGDGSKLFTTWAQVQQRYREQGDDTPANWSAHIGGGDWQRNVLAGLALLRDAPIQDEMRAKAADGMVLFRSERQIGIEGHPWITPPRFFGPFENLNSLCSLGSTWRWDVPPAIRAGQTFTVPDDAPEGAFVGLVVTDGGLPRASRPEGTDAFVIVEQPPGNPFAVSRGGGLRLAGKAPAGTHTLKLYATTYDEKEQEHRGPTVPVTVKVGR